VAGVGAGADALRDALTGSALDPLSDGVRQVDQGTPLLLRDRATLASALATEPEAQAAIARQGPR